jgi:predicted ATPase
VNSAQIRSSDPSSTFVVALQRLGPALVGEPDRRLLGLDAVDGGVGHPEPDVAAVVEPLGDEVLEPSCWA